jgi:hypothetical protein
MNRGRRYRSTGPNPIIWIILLLLFLTSLGCNTPFIPTPKPEPLYVTIPANTDYKSIMSWEIGKLHGNSPTPIPTPNPTPIPSPDGKIKVGDDCPAPCEDGYTFGDGANPQVCWKCNGDGRADEGDPILDPVNQTTAPTLAPLPEIKMIAPITIHVEKQPVAQGEISSVYYVEKDGNLYIWNDSTRTFDSEDRTIHLDSDKPIEEVEEITINYGDYFRRFPVEKKTYAKSGTDRESQDGGGND